MTASRFRAVAVATAWGALATVVLASRWHWIGRFGSDLPNWDQWDAEGAHLLAPWREGSSVLREIFQPHNEHRVILSKLWSWGIVAASGVWDQRLMCALNALWPACIVAGLWRWSAAFLPGRWQVAVGCVLAVAWSLPLAWQNILGGFHSQQFFLIGLGFVAIGLLPFAPPGSPRWWLGGLATVLALGSMGSGLLAAAVIAAVVLVRLARQELRGRQAMPTLGLCAVVLVLGWWSRVEVPYHSALKAQSIADFALAVWRSVIWPAPWAPLGAVLWLPWTWLVGQELRRAPHARSPHQLRLSALGAWVLIQIAATAYARGAGAPEPASRYLDTLLFGVCINGLALAHLAEADGKDRKATLAWSGMALLWLAVFLVGVTQQTRRSLDEMAAASLQLRAAEDTTREFLHTGDVRLLQERPIPYPDAGAFAQHVQRPSLRGLLPPSVRSAVVASAIGTEGFRLAGADDPHALPALWPEAGNRRWGTSLSDSGVPHPAAVWTGRIHTPAHWVRFDVAGGGDAALEIAEANTLRELRRDEPGRAASRRIHTFYVAVPRQGLLLRATSRSGWIAFSGPTPAPGASVWAHRAVAAAGIVGSVALMLGAFSLVSLLFSPRGVMDSTPPQ